jgi:PPM family protein phosphatase
MALAYIRPGVELASLTDVGCQREQNEDGYAYCEPEKEEEFRARGRLLIVADGMGGHRGGVEASRLAVNGVCENYIKGPARPPQAALVASLQTAHQNIRQHAREHPELGGMGTTCTAAAVVGRQLFFAHVGDSRLYLVRGSAITRLTKDHSFVNRLIEDGIIRPEEAESHPHRNLLTDALGAKNDVHVDCPKTPLSLEAGDILVICTDGLWGQVNDHEIMARVVSADPTEACRQLVDLAKQRGGPDNITVQVLRVSGTRAEAA